jgi:uncharacterized membrane protein
MPLQPRPKIPRVTAVDALRGLIIALMAIDHIRDFFHSGAMDFNPVDLARTTTGIFLTRWITHFCAPVFALTAGMGAWFWLERGHTKAQLSRFLWTRGLWLIFLELTAMRLAVYFQWSRAYPVLLLVFWSLGGSMIVLAALVHLPFRLLAVLGIASIALHNLLDGVRSPSPLWTLLHRPGAFPLAGYVIAVPYSLLPWAGVVIAGFCCGRLFRLDPAPRQRTLRALGLAMTAAFLVLRAIDRYGDPAPWTARKSALFTALSFLNCTKYPPSLDFLLMTLGPALVLLAWLDADPPRWSSFAVTLGRAPLFFYVAHFFLVHALAVAFAYARYGRAAAAFEWGPPPSMGAPRSLFPADYGYDLWVVYAVWIGVLLALYPLCRRWAAWKATRRHWWLSYL